MHYFFKNLLYSQAQIRKTTCIVMMTKEGSTQIINFMTSRAWVLMLGHCHISLNSEYVLSSTLLIIAIVLRPYWLLRPVVLLFFIFMQLTILLLNLRVVCKTFILYDNATHRPAIRMLSLIWLCAKNYLAVNLVCMDS